MAEHKITKQHVAVKFIHKDKLIENSKLVKDITILKQIHHTHIARVFDVFFTDEYLQLISESFEDIGLQLYDEICQREKFTEIHVKELLKQILDALAYLHSKHIAHRDITPEHIIVCSKLKPHNFILFYLFC